MRDALIVRATMALDAVVPANWDIEGCPRLERVREMVPSLFPTKEDLCRLLPNYSRYRALVAQNYVHDEYGSFRKGSSGPTVVDITQYV